jgi:tRNA (cytidine/uridine-2'-O-)-methyltransferase
MIHIALYEPEIPPNTGNIIRLCANIGAQLHLIQPLGFALDDQKLRRAGLDYHEFSQVITHEHWDAFHQHHATAFEQQRIFACTTKGHTRYSDAKFQAGDVLLFGPESRGLPINIINNLPAENRLRIPMQINSRSLNLSNAVAIIAYEACRQQGFMDLLS